MSGSNPGSAILLWQLRRLHAGNLVRREIRMVKQYRKKPVVIEAVQFDGTNAEEIFKSFYRPTDEPWTGDGTIKIRTLEGVLEASAGDFIIRGVKGELYPCKPDIFEKTYEAVEATGCAMPNQFGFAFALQLLKAGKKVRRFGWNGKGMHLAYMPGYPEGVPANGAAAAALGVPEGEIIHTRPYIAMKDAQGYLVTGWLASQTDLLAEDWELVD
jgi:hypothetical protein